MLPRRESLPCPVSIAQGEVKEAQPQSASERLSREQIPHAHSRKPHWLERAITRPPAAQEQSSVNQPWTRKNNDPERGHPYNPSRWPPERVLLLLGIAFFPLWILGAFWRWRDHFDPFAELHQWRCRVMLMLLSVIATGLVVVEVVFRER